jgi:hypothetical protein
MTQAMEAQPEMGFDSYDRFFPSQDPLPKGGFGNLILKHRPVNNKLLTEKGCQGAENNSLLK